METLNLAFLADRSEPFYQGGYETHLWELSRRLVRQHHVTVFTSLPAPRLKMDGVNFVRIAPPWSYVGSHAVHSFPQAAVFGISCVPRLHALDRFDFVDILSIPYSHIPPIRLLGTLEGWTWGLTIWEAWHDYAFASIWLRRLSRVAFRGMMTLATKGSHRIITGSRQTRRTLAERYGVFESRIALVPPGIDVKMIDVASPSSQVSDLICLGRLAPYKRIGDVLTAVAILCRRGFPVKAAIVGDGPERASLETRARELGVGHLVRFHGFVDAMSKYALLKASKCFVLASEREGFSIATLEAMACNLVPVVAVPAHDEVFGVSDLIQDGGTGLHFGVGRASALAEAIQKVLSNPSYASSLAKAARKAAEGHTWESTVRAYQSEVLQQAGLRLV